MLINRKFDTSRNLSTCPSQLHRKANWSFATQSRRQGGFGGLRPSETMLHALQFKYEAL